MSDKKIAKETNMDRKEESEMSILKSVTERRIGNNSPRLATTISKNVFVFGTQGKVRRNPRDFDPEGVS